MSILYLAGFYIRFCFTLLLANYLLQAANRCGLECILLEERRDSCQGSSQGHL